MHGSSCLGDTVAARKYKVYDMLDFVVCSIYLAISSGIFNGVTIPAVRAMMSKLVDSDEQGKMMRQSFITFHCVMLCQDLIIILIVGSSSLNKLFFISGSLFAVIASASAISTLVASLIFNNIYKLTVSTLPGLCFLLMAGLLIFPLFLMM